MILLLEEILSSKYKHLQSTVAWRVYQDHTDGLVQDCSNSGALAMELLQSCSKPSIWTRKDHGPRGFWESQNTDTRGLL